MLTVSNVLSSATVIARSSGLFLLKHIAMVCSAVLV